MKVRTKGKKIEPINEKNMNEIDGINIKIEENQSIRDIVDSCIIGLVFNFNSKEKNKMSKLECLLCLIVPNNSFIDKLTEKIHSELNLPKITKNQIIMNLKEIVYRDNKHYIEQTKKEMKKQNPKISTYAILCGIQKMNEEGKISDRILKNNGIDYESNNEYILSLKKELESIIDKKIADEKEMDFQKEVKKYTDNYTKFTFNNSLYTACKGNQNNFKFSNTQYAMRWKQLLEKIGKYSLLGEEQKKINQLLKEDKKLTVAEKNILDERKKVLIRNKECSKKNTEDFIK